MGRMSSLMTAVRATLRGLPPAQRRPRMRGSPGPRGPRGKAEAPTRDASLAGNGRRPQSRGVSPTDHLKAKLQAKLPATLDLLRQMVGINSWTRNRAGVDRLARITAEAFADLGFTAEPVPSVEPAYGDHLVLTRPGRSAKSVAMVAHLDQVFPARRALLYLLAGYCRCSGTRLAALGSGPSLA